jgi:hypothetical protein
VAAAAAFSTAEAVVMLASFHPLSLTPDEYILCTGIEVFCSSIHPKI